MQVPKHNARAGFSLMEVIISVTIVATLTAVAIPVAGTMVDQAAAKATKAEMQVLAQAAEAYLMDTLELPADVDDLIDNAPLSGWTGPYLAGTFADPHTGSVGYDLDQWGTAYRITRQGDVWRITSDGPDRKKNTSDDFELEIDVTHLRRAETLDRLKTLNQAISAYNVLYLLSDPLPTSTNGVLAALVASGLLPDDARYAVDAWGDAFVTDPVGQTPVVRMNSTHLQPASGSGGSGGSIWGS